MRIEEWYLRRGGRDPGFGIGIGDLGLGIGIGDLGLWRVGVSVLGYGLRTGG